MAHPTRVPVALRRGLKFPPPIVGVLLAALAAPAPAQLTPPPPRAPDAEEAVLLSPFTITSDRDVGYEASESLAGTGLKTRLTDLGAAVSVITSRFLEDTASFNLRDVLVYQTNMEATGFGGNYSGATPAPGAVTSEPALGNGPVGTRVRGLAEATQALNFYRTVIPMDGYNTDRVEINRGANALLFGVGSPAGIINTSTAAANLTRSAGVLDLSLGSHGATRAALNANVVLRRGELALRFAAVKGDDRFQQEFTYGKTDRRYLTAAWDIRPLRDRGLLDATTVRASLELGELRSNRARTLTPSDRLSSWFDATLPADLRAAGARGKVSYDPTAGPFNTFTAALRNATLGVPENVNRSPTFVFQNVRATAPRDNVPLAANGQPLLGRGMVSNNVFYPNTGLTGTAVTAYSRELSRVRADYGLADQAFYTAENLTDPTVFNFFDHLLAGPNSEARSNFRNLEVSVQQLLLRRRAGVELSYNHQRWREGYQSLMNQLAPYISIDVNTRMWTGEPNPNFGRPFISTAGAASYREEQVETARAKLFYELNLPERLSPRFGGLVGRQVFSLLGQRERFRTDARGGGSMFYTPDTWANGNNQARTAAQSKQIVTLVYVGPSLLNATSPAGARLEGLQQNLMNMHHEINGKGVVVSRVQAPSVAVARDPSYTPFTAPLTVRREDHEVTNTAGFASLNERVLESRALSLQGNWLRDRVVSTVGWRRERSSIRGVGAPFDPAGEGYVRVDSPLYSLGNPALTAQRFEQTLFAWSGVVKLPAGWLRHLPGVTALNLHYGASENFSPPATRTVDPFGVEIAPPRGITRESGVHLELFQGRVTARVNVFETTQTGSFNQTVGSIPAAIMGMYSQAVTMVRGGFVPDGGGGVPAGFVTPPQALLDTFRARVVNGFLQYTDPGVRDTSDFVSRGTEAELLLRPTRGLSLVLNVSEQRSVRSNTGAAVRRLLFATPAGNGKPLATEWKGEWAYQVPLNVGAIPNLGSRTDVNMLANNFQALALNRFNTAAAGDGAPVAELRRWRANAVASYEFQAERFRGFGLGAGLRWLDRAAIGYPVVSLRADLSPVPPGGPALPSDVRVSDVRNPFYGPAETRHDAWISYQRKILGGRVGLKLQLNARNLLTRNQLVPVVINPDGRNAVYSIAEGRKLTFSSRFSF
jgi:outer membrane receptor protein involved in Fe transport